jgi:UDP-N-acetylmuramoylalanine--D-glutamate ligase
MDVSGKKVCIVGMGETSLALVKLLLHHGAQPFVTEFKSHEEVIQSANELDSFGVAYECGGHSNTALTNAKLMIPSPGVSPEISLIQSARNAGIPIMSEIEFASRYCQSKIVAVTGTNGKTTTTELIAHVMRTCGLDVALCGNNETPFSMVVAQKQQPEYVVIEVSSYQLDLVSSFAPNIGVVLNLTNDHLQRHKTMENYAATKARLFAAQKGTDTAILNADDDWVKDMEARLKSRVLKFSQCNPKESVCCIENDLLVEDVIVAQRSYSPLPGEHNTENILATLGVMSVLDADCSAMLDGLKSFSGVEHRIEHVAEFDDVVYYNDSKSTNLDSLKVALESFDAPIILIAGGDGKGSDYSLLNTLIEQRVKHLVAIGTDAPIIINSWVECTKTSSANSMLDAVRRAHSQAEAGDVILLSPACASFDMYSNFEERGQEYKACVHTILEEVGR